MKTSEQIDAISTALSLAQGEMESASKTTVNPFFKSRYSSLPQIWEVAKEPLRKNKLVLVQDLVTTDKGISVTTRICHASGQWMEFGPLEIPSAKKDAQGLGSAASYGRRYALAAALSIVSDEDDDGNAACAPAAQQKAPPKLIEKEKALEICEWCKADPQWWDKTKKAFKVERVGELLDSQYDNVKASFEHHQAKEGIET